MTPPSQQEFKPAWWLPEGHTQTLWRKFAPPERIIQKRERVELDDGDFIDLDWAAAISGSESRDRIIVVILHGLCGCSSSPYVAALQTLLTANSIASVAMNFRGCSGEYNRLARAYHSGVSADANVVFSDLFSRFPDHRFAFVGYSLGANVLLKWLGEIRRHPQVMKAVAVSTPFALDLCSRAMLRGVSRAYGSYFVRRLLQDLDAKRQHFTATHNALQLEQLQALGSLDDIRTIWEFDDRVTAPLHGFRDAEDYYGHCSSLHFLPGIATDTLLIQSRNDPLIPAAALPNPARLSAQVRLELLGQGGHVGFISGQRENWLEQRILRFILLD
jgi:predicted alpha/beta-fold hydrolase